MKIYIGHSSSFDYKTDLYDVIEASDIFKKHDFIFPHSDSVESQNGKEFYRNIDLFIAEVSYPSTGLGIELAWAEGFGRKIVCIHRSDMKPSGAISTVCSELLTYSNEEEFLDLLSQVIV